MSELTPLHVAIVEHLNKLLEKPGELDYDSLEVATQCLTEALQVDTTSSEHSKYLLASQGSSLEQIFQNSSPTPAVKGTPGTAEHWNSYLHVQLGANTDLFAGSEEYTQRVQEIAAAYQKEFDVQLRQVVTHEITDEDRQLAEQYKTQGNQLLGQSDFFTAIERYTDAIKLNPENHIYFANRGLAYYKLQRFTEALTDFNTSIKLNGSYSKSHYRLAQTYAVLKRYDEAIAAFKRAADVARQNQENTLVQEIEQQRKVVESDMHRAKNPRQQQQQQPPQQQQGAGGFDLSSIMSNPMFSNILQGLMGGQQGAGQQPTGDDDDESYDDDDQQDDDYEDDGDEMADATGAASQPSSGSSSAAGTPDISAILRDVQQNGISPDLINRYMSDPNLMQQLGPLLAGFQQNFGGQGQQ